MTDLSDMQLAQSIVAGGQTIQTATPPARLVLLADLGILAHESVRGQVVHRTAAPGVPLFETRATVTPGGDFLLMFPNGGHYGRKNEKVNEMLAYRSSD